MARVVITKTCTIAASGPNPARMLNRGEVLEMTAAEQAQVTSAGGTLRATTVHGASAGRDQLGEAGGFCSNSTIG